MCWGVVEAPLFALPRSLGFQSPGWNLVEHVDMSSDLWGKGELFWEYPLGNSHIISHPKNRDGTGRSSKVAWKGIWGMVVPSRVAYLEMLINVEYPWIFLN